MSTCCKVIGERISDQQLRELLTDGKVSVSDAFCTQLGEILGCVQPESRLGFIPFAGFGPRGPRLRQTNPPREGLVCPTSKRKARKHCGACSPVSS